MAGSDLAGVAQYRGGTTLHVELPLSAANGG
jgi:hypothetical protein